MATSRISRDGTDRSWIGLACREAARAIAFASAVGMASPALGKKAAPPPVVDDSVETLGEDAFADTEGALAAAEEFEQQASRERERERQARANAAKAKNEAKIAEHQAKIEIARSEGEIKSARRARATAENDAATASAARRKSEHEIDVARKRIEKYEAERDRAQKEAERSAQMAAESKAQAEALKNQAEELRIQLSALRKEQARLEREHATAKNHERETSMAYAKAKATMAPEIARSRAEIGRLQSAIDSSKRRAAANEAGASALRDSLDKTRLDLSNKKVEAMRAAPSQSAAESDAAFSKTMTELSQNRDSGASKRVINNVDGAAGKVAPSPRRSGRLLEKDCNLREKPNFASAVLQPVMKGSRLEVEASEGAWFRATVADAGATGFIAKSCFR